MKYKTNTNINNHISAAFLILARDGGILFIFIIIISLMSCDNNKQDKIIKKQNKVSQQLFDKQSINCVSNFDIFDTLLLNNNHVNLINKNKFIKKYSNYDSITNNNYIYYGKSCIQFDVRGHMISFTINDSNLICSLINIYSSEDSIAKKFPCSYQNKANENDEFDKPTSVYRIQLFDDNSNRITFFVDKGYLFKIDFENSNSDFDNLN